jgi:alkanesulfonate monooxygenase SsuD/methylene tetrahydromethanopterin reductase-like flavin-dependent oxidoreductase (luciferase family)
VRLCLSIEIQEGMTYADTLAMTLVAEDLGFDAALLAEHYYASGIEERYAGGLASRMAADPWPFLGGLARETSRIRLGTLVSPVTFRHPSVVAKMAATLDHMSDGRAELGLGAGWFAQEHAAFGFSFPEPKQRVDLVEEQLRVITGLWSQDPFSFDGAHYQLRDCHFTPKPVQQPRPTLIVGGSARAERLPRLAARYGDEYTITLPSIEQCQAIRARLPEHVRLSVFTPICIGETEQQVRERYDFLAETEPQYRRMMNAETAWIMGTPAQAAQQIADLERVGVARLLLSVSCDLHRLMLPLLSGTPAARG